MTLFIVFGVSLLLLGVNGECNFPPSLWCETKEIARQCQVLEQCNTNVWSRSKWEMKTPQVNFSVYIESLCPDCKHFIVNTLYPTWKKIGDIMNLTLVPYGNAFETYHTGKWVYKCQHGEEECIGNVIETCTIHYYKDVKKHFPFIYCLESSSEMPDATASKCAKMYNLDYDKIMMCANSTLGNWLEHGMAVKTNKLDPPHKYVPWVTLNGVHTEKIQMEAQKDLLRLICTTYMGKKPDACNM